VNRLNDWQYLRQMTVTGDVLVAGTYQEKLLGLSLRDGGELWSVNAGNFINSQHVSDGVAYFWSPTGWIYAVDTVRGRVLWRHRTTDYRRGAGNWAALAAELASAGPRLFALDLDDVLHVLNRDSGYETGRYKVPGPVQSFVVPVSPEKIALGTIDGDLVLCDLPA
jgi:outer membrane protein assembly factor BamB